MLEKCSQKYIKLHGDKNEIKKKKKKKVGGRRKATHTCQFDK